jgi:glycosyltransferase involved in cell wall biosynthesis
VSVDGELNAHDDVWVVVRCFNEAPVVGDVLRDLRKVFPRIIAVDDGSTDDSYEVMAATGVDTLRHAVNLGPGAALQTGILYGLLDRQAQWFVCFDADGQHRVADAVAMVDHARSEGLDILIGSRFLGRAENLPPLRRRVLRLGAVFERLMSGVRLSDGHNGLRVFSRRFAETVDLRLPGMAYASELLEQISRSGLPYGEHPVTIDYTPYSLAKGQRSLNSINIAVDVWINRLLRGGRQ